MYIFIFSGLFYLNSKQVAGNTIIDTWGGKQGGVMSQIMYTEDINTGINTHVFQINKAVITLKET